MWCVKTHTFKQKLKQIFIHNIWLFFLLLRYDAPHFIESLFVTRYSLTISWLSLWWFLQYMIKIMHSFAHCTDISNSSKIQLFTHLGITVMNLWKHHSYFKHTTKFFRKLQNWAHISIWIIINHIDNYQHIFYETNFQKYFPFTHICCHISYRLSDTKIIMTSQRHYARNPQNHAYIFIAHGLAHPASWRNQI